MNIGQEAPTEASNIFQSVLLMSDDELLFWAFVLMMGLLALNRIIVDVKAMVEEVQSNPETHIPGLRNRFLPFRR